MEEKKEPAGKTMEEAGEQMEGRNRPGSGIIREESLSIRRKYSEKLREYSYLNREDMRERKAVLWQLISCDCSDVLIDTLLREDAAIRDEDITLYASLVMVIGEDFFFDQLYQKMLPVRVVAEKAAFYVLSEKYRQKGSGLSRGPDEGDQPARDEGAEQKMSGDNGCGDQLPFSLETVLSQLAASVEKVQKEADERTARLLGQSEELWKMKFVQMRAYQRVRTDRLREERDSARRELETCMKKLRKAEAIIEQTREQMRLLEMKTGERISGSLPVPADQEGSSDEKRKGFLARHRERRIRQEIINEGDRRRQKVEAWLRGDMFSDEQMKIVRRVCLSSLPLKSLEQICDPRLNPDNMAALEAFLMKQEVVYVQDK